MTNSIANPELLQAQVDQAADNALEAIRAAQASGNGNVHAETFTSLDPRNNVAEGAHVPSGKHIGTLVADIDRSSGVAVGAEANLVSVKKDGVRHVRTSIGQDQDMASITVERAGQAPKTFTGEKAVRLGSIAINTLAGAMKSAAEQ